MQIRTKVRAGALLTAVVAAASLGVLPAAAATAPDWEVTLLPMPDGASGGQGYLTGTDGKGGYAGEFLVDGTSQVITWTAGRPTLRGLPAGFEFASVRDENSAGTVVGSVSDYETGTDRPFILDGNGFHVLTLPPGYSSGYGVAINDRGDVIGNLYAQDASQFTNILWPTMGSGPVVIPASHKEETAIDIDEDGTALLNHRDGASLWKNGVSRELAKPAGNQNIHAAAIKNGSVVGTLLGVQGLLWRTPDNPESLPGSESAGDINASGLIIGRLPQPSTPYGPIAAWQDTTALGKLPLPTGFANGSVYAVGGNGAIAGVVSNGPRDEGGAPAVWRSTLHS